MTIDNDGEERAAAASAPAGWFDDPHGKHDLRYWDGSAWSEHVHDRESAAAPVQPARPPAEPATAIATAGQNGRKWGVLVAAILLIGAVILVATSLSGNDSPSATEGRPSSSGSDPGIDGGGEGSSGGSDGASDTGKVADLQEPEATDNSPEVIYTASVESTNTKYGSISNQIAIAGGHVWAVSPDAVTILDESNGEFVGSIPVDSTDAAGLFADGDRVWLLSPFTKTLKAINADSGTVEGEVVLTSGVHRPTSGLLLTDGYAWVPNGYRAASNSPGFDIVEVIDTTTFSIVKQLEVSEGTGHLMYAEGKVWMENSLSNEVTVIDVDTLSVVATIPSGDFPSDIAYADGMIWVANARGATVSVIDPASMDIVDEITVGIAMTPDDEQFPGPRHIHGVGTSVWITMSQDQSLKVIDTTTHAVIDSIPGAGDFAFTDSAVWVVKGTEVEAFDLDSHQSLGLTRAGSGNIYDMASTRDGLWVVNEDDALSKLAVGAG